MLIALLLLVACTPTSEDTSGGGRNRPTETPDILEVDYDQDYWSPDEGDCDDGNPAVNPGEVDYDVDGLDQNCDGVDGPDKDGDHYVALSRGGDDCDDENPDVYPDHTDVTCDGVDNNCDGVVDDQATFTIYYADADSDGYGDAGAPSEPACDLPDGYVADDTDCNDGDAASYPGAEEVWYDGVDQDCGGEWTYNGYEFPLYDYDQDGDGYGIEAPEMVDVWGANGDWDCDDINKDVNPGAIEDNTDMQDNNCSGAMNAFFFRIDWSRSDMDGSDPVCNWGLCDKVAIFHVSANDLPFQESAKSADINIDIFEPGGTKVYDRDASPDSGGYLVTYSGGSLSDYDWLDGLLAADAQAGLYTYKIVSNDVGMGGGGGCWVWGYDVSLVPACPADLHVGDTTGWSYSGDIAGMPE